MKKSTAMLVRCKNSNQIPADAVIRSLESGSTVELSEAVNGSGANGFENSWMAQKLTQVFSMNCFEEEVGTLSIREREVLEFLSRGFLIKEIPDQMGISFDTVRTYIRRIYQKLHVHSRTQAVAKYLRPGNAINT